MKIKCSNQDWYDIKLIGLIFQKIYIKVMKNCYLLHDICHFGAVCGSNTTKPSSQYGQSETPWVIADSLQVGWVHWLQPDLISIPSNGGFE